MNQQYWVRRKSYSEEDGDIETAVYWDIVDPTGFVSHSVIFWLNESREEVIQALSSLRDNAIALSVTKGMDELEEAIQDELNSP